MNSVTDAEKKHLTKFNVNACSRKKNVTKVVIKETYINTIKTMYDKPRASLVAQQ